MKLYVYDHCPFCAKARMIFGLKSLPLELTFVLEDDVETLTKLVGKKTLPILEKEDGSHLFESMDIVHYLDQHYGEALLGAPADNSAIKAWHDGAWKPILNDDFVLYPSLRMLSVVKGVNYPPQVRRYMEHMAQATGVGLHFDQAR